MPRVLQKQQKKDFPAGIPSYGTDALRFTFCALASTGRDVKFDLNRIEGYQNFCNKLWNATKFVLMNTENFDPLADIELSVIDRWMISKTHDLIGQTEFALETFRFDIFANNIYEFAWHEYCDWYLELTKPLLWDTNTTAAQREGTKRTLLHILESLFTHSPPGDSFYH